MMEKFTWLFSLLDKMVKRKKKEKKKDLQMWFPLNVYESVDLLETV